MRALVVADVHANLEALDAVLKDAHSGGEIDAIWCLGDVVGYGAEPEACIERLRSYDLHSIAGNHDLAAAGAASTAKFNSSAARAAEWTSGQLRSETKAWLRSLPNVLVVGDHFTLTHGSLIDPVWEYLVTPETAEAQLGVQTTPYGFVGHSHLPLLFYEGESRPLPPNLQSVVLDGQRFVANPGSVGQPRDGDPRAAYAVVDTDAREVSFRRVAYDVSSAQRKIRDAGLPEVLADRLAFGR